MQPSLVKINIPEKSTFSVNRYTCIEGFPNLWHFHDEFELTLVVKGRGFRMVGDSMEEFYEGDLTLIGENLPHVWQTTSSRLSRTDESLVVHFLHNFLGNSFFDIPGMEKIKALLNRSYRGLHIYGKTRERVAYLLKEIEKQDLSDQIVHFLSMLNILSKSEELVELSSVGFSNRFNEIESTKLDKILKFVMKNFRRQINISEVADIACMTPTSFSRYFKNKTRKTFTEFLTEVRIGHACKLLINGDLSVAQVCYESGFQNFSNFNEKFKSAMRLTPKKYQTTYTKGIS